MFSRWFSTESNVLLFRCILNIFKEKKKRKVMFPPLFILAVSQEYCSSSNFNLGDIHSWSSPLTFVCILLPHSTLPL